jgi:hypothetical protein
MAAVSRGLWPAAFIQALVSSPREERLPAMYLAEGKVEMCS